MNKRGFRSLAVFVLLILCVLAFLSVSAESGKITRGIIASNWTKDLATLAVRHTLRITASANPAPIQSGGTTKLDANITDSKDHTATYKWSDNGAGGTFAPGIDVKSTTWTGPGNTTDAAIERNLTVTAICSDKRPLTVSVTLKVPEEPKK